jgi:putative spermidine/putrescine transport system permease protein
MRGRFGAGLLLVPAGVLFLFLLVLPLAFLVGVSLVPHSPSGSAPTTTGLSFDGYRELADPYVFRILWRTVRVSLLVTALCLVLGYPLSLSVARSAGAWRSVQLILVISPLFVSIVVRSYGWLLLLGNRGIINGMLTHIGLVSQPLKLLNTEGAVVVGLAEALLPFMVLSLAAVLERQDPSLREAARGLGASPVTEFLKVTLPLSLPGALAGSLLVFMVAMGSYATPALLGGSQVRLMVTEIYTQVTAVYNWQFGAALSVALLLVSLLMILLAHRLAKGRTE